MRKALVVGIDQYRTAPLRGCINDAQAMASILGRHGDGTVNFAVRLANNVSTRSELMSMIVELFRGDDDAALFYFSGHGFVNALGGYIVTPDHRKYDEGVSMDEILTVANQSRIKDKIIILDCCYSGAMGTPRITGSNAAYLIEGMVILTASRDSEESIEVNGHGIFTNLLLDALRGGAADLRGHITPGSVYAYIDQALGPWSQRPVFKTNVTRFTSLRRVQPPIPLENLRKLSEYFPDVQYEYPLTPAHEITNQGVAISENVSIFKNLQKLESVGLVVPVGEEHMYWAAQHNKACRLTPLGFHYWRLIRENLI